MQCEKCKIKRATVFFTEPDRTRHAMCATCAALTKEGAVDACENQAKYEYLPYSHMYELIHNSEDMYFGENISDKDIRCFSCDKSLYEILSQGRMGCKDCYRAFSGIAQFSEFSVGGYLKFNSKMPRRYIDMMNTQKRISKLKSLLDEAVAVQNFEMAAKFRDEIKTLSEQMKGA